MQPRPSPYEQLGGEAGVRRLVERFYAYMDELPEAADTRCWGLLPDKIQVLRIELPAGRHRVTP